MTSPWVREGGSPDAGLADAGQRGTAVPATTKHVDDGVVSDP
jgi:hypothetical protein